MKLRSIVEADDTFVLASCKGDRGWQRTKAGQLVPDLPDLKPRKRGGEAQNRGLSDEQVPVLVAADLSGATGSKMLPVVTAEATGAVLAPVLDKNALLVTDGGTVYPSCVTAFGNSHEVLYQSLGQRARLELQIQTVNNRHWRLKDFLRSSRGFASKYVVSYMRWLYLIVLHNDPTQRHCLAAETGRKFHYGSQTELKNQPLEEKFYVRIH